MIWVELELWIIIALLGIITYALLDVRDELRKGKKK